MALSIQITKKSISRQQDKLYNISVNFSLRDGTVEVLNQDFSIRYRTGDNIATKKIELQRQIQEVIDNYKAEQVLFNNAAFQTMCTNIQSGLIL
jgi:hypothetical protein